MGGGGGPEDEATEEDPDATRFVRKGTKRNKQAATYETWWDANQGEPKVQ